MEIEPVIFTTALVDLNFLPIACHKNEIKVTKPQYVTKFQTYIESS